MFYRLFHLLTQVDLSVVTSASESFGLFALESMASGVPVLATRCGGLEEVFKAERSGELYAAMTAEVGDVIFGTSSQRGRQSGDLARMAALEATSRKLSAKNTSDTVRAPSKL